MVPSQRPHFAERSRHIGLFPLHQVMGLIKHQQIPVNQAQGFILAKVGVGGDDLPWLAYRPTVVFGPFKLHQVQAKVP